MKNIRYIVFIVVVFSSTMYSQKNQETLKVISYNIWNGFDWGKDIERQEKLISWVNAQKPDVVALQELCAYTDEKLQQDAKGWGHDYSLLLKTSGYSVGITSNQPIELVEKIRKGMHHGALHCSIAGIEYLVVHLSPGSYLKRRSEAKILLNKLEKIQKENPNYVVLGDYNAITPIDADLYDAEGYFLNRLRKSNKDKPLKGNLLNGNLEYGVMSAFLSFPLIDVCQSYTNGMEERGSFPGRVLGPINKESTAQLVSRLQRIDYILTSPLLSTKSINASIANGEENWYLSDHYPVIAEFKLN